MSSTLRTVVMTLAFGYNTVDIGVTEDDSKTPKFNGYITDNLTVDAKVPEDRGHDLGLLRHCRGIAWLPLSLRHHSSASLSLY
jgi:hypothetical protein